MEEEIGLAADHVRPLLTIRDLTLHFSVDETTIRRWVRQGAFPAPSRIGGVVRWCPGCVDLAVGKSARPQCAEHG